MGKKKEMRLGWEDLYLNQRVVRAVGRRIGWRGMIVEISPRIRRFKVLYFGSRKVAVCRRPENFMDSA